MHLSLSHFSVHETTVVHVFFSWNTSFVYCEFYFFKCGNLPLHHASMKGHTDIVKLLLDSGSELDAQDKVCTLCI